MSRKHHIDSSRKIHGTHLPKFFPQAQCSMTVKTNKQTKTLSFSPFQGEGNRGLKQVQHANLSWAPKDWFSSCQNLSADRKGRQAGSCWEQRQKFGLTITPLMVAPPPGSHSQYIGRKKTNSQLLPGEGKNGTWVQCDSSWGNCLKGLFLFLRTQRTNETQATLEAWWPLWTKGAGWLVAAPENLR